MREKKTYKDAFHEAAGIAKCALEKVDSLTAELDHANAEIMRLNEAWWLTAIEKRGHETMHNMDTAMRQEAEYKYQQAIARLDRVRKAIISIKEDWEECGDVGWCIKQALAILAEPEGGRE